MATAAAPSAGITQAGEPRSARIESLRALAAIAVTVAHVWAVSQAFAPQAFLGFSNHLRTGGVVGVYLFLVLTGYLLFWPFARRDYAGGHAVDIRRYALNRGLRILPLYYVVLIVLLLVQEHGGTFEQWWRFALFAQNFSDTTIERVDGPMWSLVVELHFYVLLPFLAYGLARVARGRLRVVTGILLALGAAAFALRCATFLYADHPSREWRYSLPTLFHFFVAGMLLALLRLRWEANRPAWVRGIAASSTAWLLASVPLWLWGVENLKAEIPLALAGFLTVGAVVLPLDHGRLVRALEWRPLSLAGIASYSLYLWHVPVVLWLAGGRFTFSADGLTSGYSGDPHRFVTLLAYALPACLLVAAISYRLIEAPFLRLRRRWS